MRTKKDKRLYHSVAEKLEKLIDDGVYTPGSRLPGERELAEQFGVSRVTIREAEIALQAVGRIAIKTGSGAYVLESDVHLNGGLPEVSAFELTEARALFESEAAALAARDIDDATLEHLAELIDVMEHGGGSAAEEAAEQADREFHMTIARASGNAAVLHVVETLWKMRNEVAAVKEVYDSVCSQSADIRGDEHTEILEALRDRSPVAARVAMREHFKRLLKTMLDTTEEQALEELRKKSNESRERFLASAHL